VEAGQRAWRSSGTRCELIGVDRKAGVPECPLCIPPNRPVPSCSPSGSDLCPPERRRFAAPYPTPAAGGGNSAAEASPRCCRSATWVLRRRAAAGAACLCPDPSAAPP